MKKGVIIAAFFAVTLLFTGNAFAQLQIVEGELILILGEMFTIKTQSEQGFGGSRITFHVDPKTTVKKGEFELGMMVRAEVDENNGHAHWVKRSGVVTKPLGQ